MVVLFAISMGSAVFGHASDTTYVWAAWLVFVLSSALFASGLWKKGIRRPVV
jgi:hypothetical protein